MKPSGIRGRRDSRILILKPHKGSQNLKAIALVSSPFSSRVPLYAILSAGSPIPEGGHVFFLLASCRFNVHLLKHIEVICQITSSGKKNVLGYYSLVQMSQTDCLHGGNMPGNCFNHVFSFSCVYMVLVF